MSIFKETKKEPIKFRNFKFIGYHSDYSRCAYYYKDLGCNNYELMECMLEGAKKPEIGAGSKVNIIDTFMSEYLITKEKDNVDIIKNAIKNNFIHADDKTKDNFYEAYTTPVPKQIYNSDFLKKFTKDGYTLLYCHDDETKDRKIAIVNIMLVKENHICSTDKSIDIDRWYTLFKPLKFMVKPGYIKGETSDKYFAEELPTIAVSHDLLK